MIPRLKNLHRFNVTERLFWTDFFLCYPKNSVPDDTTCASGPIFNPCVVTPKTKRRKIIRVSISPNHSSLLTSPAISQSQTFGVYEAKMSFKEPLQVYTLSFILRPSQNYVLFISYKIKQR